LNVEWFSLLILFVSLLLRLLPSIKGYIAMTTVLNELISLKEVRKC
jgi:hypothetical protein